MFVTRLPSISAPIRVEYLLDLGRQVDHLLEHFRRQLVALERKLRESQRPGVDGIEPVLDRHQPLDPAVGIGIAVVQSQGQRGLGRGVEILLLARVGRDPPGQVRGDFQLGELRLVVRQQRLRLGDHLLRLLLGGSLCGIGAAGRGLLGDRGRRRPEENCQADDEERRNDLLHGFTPDDVHPVPNHSPHPPAPG